MGQHDPARAIEAFVDMLDLAALGFDIEPEATGRPGYHHAVMLKIYLYGYLNHVQSSRRLTPAAAAALIGSYRTPIFNSIGLPR